LPTAFERTVKHGLITHYHPLSVLCCAAHTWMIWRMTADRRWQCESDDWLDVFRGDWARWLEHTPDPFVGMWFHRTKAAADAAWETLFSAGFGPCEFDPFATEFDGVEGCCL